MPGFKVLLPLLLGGVLITAACSTLKGPARNMSKSALEPDYTLVYIIHGDANYLYHQAGENYYADVEALKDAFSIGRQATKGEVFIFYQRPEKKLLWLFPQKDRHYYHFKNGQILTSGRYSPKGGGFEAEASLYNTLSSKDNRTRAFIYFGHEIPTFKNRVYHHSRPEQLFDTDVFKNGLAGFHNSFDLTVLSTCNNGNPYMVHELSELTEVIVASPQDLHLSHLDSKTLLQLNSNPHTKPITLAHSLAENSFERLAESLQTVVTVSVYDMNKVRPYIDSLYKPYRQYLDSVRIKPYFTDNIDCMIHPAYASPVDTAGVDIYYKPASFGVLSEQEEHSGWGCRK